MKKALPIILLIIGGILTCKMCADSFGFLIYVFKGYWVIPYILLIAGHVTAAMFFQIIYQQHCWLNKRSFWLCAGLPGTLIGVLSLILYSVLVGQGYIVGGLSRIDQFLAAITMCFYSGAFFVVLGIVLLIVHVVSRRKPKI